METLVVIGLDAPSPILTFCLKLRLGIFIIGHNTSGSPALSELLFSDTK